MTLERCAKGWNAVFAWTASTTLKRGTFWRPSGWTKSNGPWTDDIAPRRKSGRGPARAGQHLDPVRTQRPPREVCHGHAGRGQSRPAQCEDLRLGDGGRKDPAAHAAWARLGPWIFAVQNCRRSAAPVHAHSPVPPGPGDQAKHRSFSSVAGSASLPAGRRRIGDAGIFPERG